MGQEASHIGPECIMSPGDVIASRRQASALLTAWHAYEGALGKSEYDMAAQQIVAASKDAGVWVIVQEFVLVTPPDLEEMVEGGILCKVKYPVYSEAKLVYGIGYMLTHKSIEQLAEKYPAKRFI